MRLRRLALALTALLSVPSVAARGGMPDALTPRGDLIESIYFQIFVAGTVVFLIVMALMVYVMVRYRAKGGAGRATFEMERENLKLEMTWIGIPLVVVLWVGVISYAGLVDLDDEEEPWMEVRITGFQWTWHADYGSKIGLFSDPDSMGNVPDANVFKVPADTPIRFNITGGDVIHAWHLMDENWATVGLVDANPYGPHKYTMMNVNLPRGEYQVQCREMCFNPGHAYMRARVEAVPMAEFQEWMEGQRLAADAAIPQTIALAWDGARLAGAENVTFVTGAGSRAIVTLANQDDGPVTVRVPGMDLLTGRFSREGVDLQQQQNLTIPGGATARFAFDINATGDYVLRAGDAELPFEVVEAEAFQVNLGDYFIEPERMELEAGTTYLFQVTNVGGVSHNIFFGEYGGEVTAASETIGPGLTTSFVFTPSQTMTFETWCDVQGHYGLGMRGTATVG